jgi:hypothetical protein
VRATKTHCRNLERHDGRGDRAARAGAYLDDLRARQLRLVVALEEIGGRTETRLARIAPAARSTAPII